MVLKPGATMATGTGPPQPTLKIGWKGAGKRMALAAQAAAPLKPPPPPPALWEIIKKQHTFVAAIIPPNKGSDDNQLRDTQLVQVFFNTIFLELMVIHILAAKMSDYDVALGARQVWAAGTLAAFFCTLGTVLCKLIYKWGNTSRRRLRKGPARIVTLFRWVRKELQGKETLFHGLQTLWYEYRTRGTKRVPKRAIKKNFVVLRGYFAWTTNMGVAITAIVFCLVYGTNFDDVKVPSTLYSWAVAAFESFVLVEPIVIMVVFMTPRLIDRTMLPEASRDDMLVPLPNSIKEFLFGTTTKNLKTKGKQPTAKQPTGKAKKYSSDLSA